MRVRQLFLDADGVLADMELGAQEVLGLTCKEYRAQHSEEKFWATLHAHPEFYETLPLMPDARVLYEAVAHLNPIILTGCPMGGWAQAQKLAWRNKHFPGVPMITTLSKDKRNEAQAGGRVDRRLPEVPALVGRDGRHLHPPQERTTIIGGTEPVHRLGGGQMNVYTQSEDGRWVPAIPEPFWFKSWRTLWFWRPGCYQCQIIFKTREEWNEHYVKHHSSD